MKDTIQPKVWVRTCDCGRQVSVRPVYKFPKHYDDPTHPISSLSPNQAARLDLEFTWSDVKEEFNGEEQYALCKTIAKNIGIHISGIYKEAQRLAPGLCKKCNYRCKKDRS
jgi:hypothetical protein